MAESTTFTREYIPSSPIVRQRSDDDDSSGETVPAKSPRYVRKKRVPVTQARKYHSQLSAQGKIYHSKQKIVEKCDKAVYQSGPSLDECNTVESQMLLKLKASNFLKNKANLSFKVSDTQANPKTLVHSRSLPSISTEPKNKLVKSKSCDILNSTNSPSLMLENQLSLKTGDPKQPLSNPRKGSESTRDFTFSDNLYENSPSKSRRSSTSTVRERHNSQDSTFSQISVIDMKEVEEAMKAVEVMVKASTSSARKTHSRSKSDATLEIVKQEPEETEVFSLPSSLTKKEPIRKKSIFEGQQMIVPTECFFPRPEEGQSLTSFLSSNQFNISAELDRENAHFCISDALIAAIEHMKCSRTMKMKMVEEDDDDSDEEIRKLSQRIRIRRREKQRERVLKNIVLLSDGKTDTTTSQSASPPLSSDSSNYEVESLCSEDEVEDLELSTQTDSNLSSMRENGLSLSMASLYSDADIQKALLNKESEKKFLESDSLNLSAESVALSLLRKFSEKQLPKASDLQWLVSEQEAPQRLLPLPDSWPISPDVIEEEYNLGNTRLRGNFEWAPPRPQIIFSMHPYMKKSEILEKQKFRCAGCGMKIEKNYINRFRLCDYFGKYFCQCCHSNSLAYIPGRILWKWDFKKYYVSKFAWGLLDNMFLDPLFNIEDVNCNLYQKVRLLESCRYYRMQLFYLKDFINTCRKAHVLKLLLEQQCQYILYEPHTYSLSDLVQVKSAELSKHLNQLVNQCIDHVKHCILCQAKGFICEICRKDSDIIFPFQFDKVILCQGCGSCFHKRCCKNIRCPRCIRIEARKKRLAECKSDDEL